MAETLVKIQVTSTKGVVFHQSLAQSPVHNPNGIISKPQDEVQLERIITGENVALAIGMLSGILPIGSLRDTAQDEFEIGVKENDIGVVRPELLNLAIALASFQDFVAGQKIIATPKPPASDNFDLHIKPHDEEFDLHARRREVSVDEIQITPLDE